MVSDAEIIGRLLLASVLGALIGLEREVHGREAGIRTYLLIALGSALIMVVSEYLMLKYQGASGEFLRVDPGRIAAQAIVGIGFLGAGAIIRYRNSTRGLTTAACMWVVCAIGLTVGSGYYLFGLVVSAITIISLTMLKAVDRRLKKDWYRDMLVVSDELEGQFERVQAILDRYHVKVTNFTVTKDRNRNELLVDFRLRFRSVQPLDRAIVGEVYALSGVKRVDLR